MSSEHDEDGIAPVIPLFGRATGAGRGRGDAAEGEGSRQPVGDTETRTFPVRRLPPAEGQERSRPLAPDDDGAAADEDWHTTWRGLGPEGGPRPAPRLETVERGGVHFVELPDDREPAGPEPDRAEAVEKAESRLLRSLGARGLSVSEARAKLRRLEAPSDAIDEVIDRLERSGALDDDALAEQIVYQASTHRNEGRKAIAQSLQKRGIARATIDRVIADLPDDDYDRALEFARSKAPRLARYDDETALRRLVGQLSRRGYGGLAMSVARRALDDQGAEGSHRVRFE